MTDNPTRPESPGEVSVAGQIEAVCDRYEAAWAWGAPPRIEDFLESVSPELRPRLLRELVMIDLERRWSTAPADTISSKAPSESTGGTTCPDLTHRPRLEDYVRSYPALGSVEGLPQDLIVAEYQARHRWGDKPDHAEYLGRFAGQADALEAALTAADEARGAETTAQMPSQPRYGGAGGLPAITLEEFVDNLAESGLMSREEVSEFHDSLPPAQRPDDGPGLGRRLVAAQKLTPYQAEQICRGEVEVLAFDEYVILDRIGAGGMGQVFKAKHRSMKRLVALKMIASKLVDSPEAVKRFQREVQAAAKLEHPNIVTAYDAREHAGRHCLIMQYVDGHDLGKTVRQRGPLPVPVVVDCILQAARGLEYAHSHGVIHRDIKPGNLLLDKEGNVKILDMGLARLDEAGDDDPEAEQFTDSSQVMGTCDYMAPEQAIDTHRVDHRADIYSLGCTLYRLLTGKRPYLGRTAMQVLVAHREAPIPSLCEARDDVPEQLDAVFQKMVAKRPEDRYQSTAEVIAELEACAFGNARTTVTVVRRTMRHQVRRNLTRYVGLAGGAALCLALLAVLIVALRNGGEEERQDADSSALGRVEAKEPTPWNLPPGAPSPAIAPFDAEQAKKHQQAWADYLGVSVEQDVDLGGGVQVTMVLIPPGEFLMGSTEEEQARFLTEAMAAGDPRASGLVSTQGPQHPVRITRAFRFGRHEVTVGQFRQFVEETGYKTEAERDGKGGRGLVDGQWVQNPRFVWNGTPSFPQTAARPVVNVAWNDAKAFCQWLSDKEGAEFVLPSEAQWEYACRAGTTTAWYWGDSDTALEIFAWFCRNSGGKTHPTGQLEPNGWALYDMYGNVWEWCADHWAPDYYAQSPSNDPSGPTTGWGRVYRSGSWFDRAPMCRSVYRNHGLPEEGHSNLGFRLASVLADQAPAARVKPSPEPDSAVWKTILPPDAPAPAVAPFDAATAKKHQDAWSDYLQVPVEREIDLGGGVNMTMVLIPPGEFLMGSSPAERIRFLEEAKAFNDEWAIERIPTEGPQHRVRITRAFRLGRHEVTVGQFREFVDETGYKTDAERDGKGGRAPIDGKWVEDPRFVWSADSGHEQTDEHPVLHVSWNDATAFCEWLSKKEGGTYVLPSEAQWEYACRAGTTTFWHCGYSETTLEKHGWFSKNSGGTTHPVGQLNPNGWSLCDMHGNVWEWCADRWATDSYARSAPNDPSGPRTGSDRVSRGGAWDCAAGWYCRSAYRFFRSPVDRYAGLGFRVACEIPARTAEQPKPTAAPDATKPEKAEPKPVPVTSPRASTP